MTTIERLRHVVANGGKNDDLLLQAATELEALQAENAALRGQVAVCPKCGNYFGGHATGGHDICDCHEGPRCVHDKTEPVEGGLKCSICHEILIP